MVGYIAHPVLARNAVRKWELQVEEATGLELVNPFIDVEREPDEDLSVSEHGNYDSVDPVEIVSLDLAAVYHCDFVVAWVTGQRSYGTIMEICYAYQKGIPVYIICTNGHENHPWLKYHAAHIFTAPEQFEKFAKKHLMKNTRTNYDH